MLLDRPGVEQSGQAPATFDGDNIDDDDSVGYGDGVVGHDKIDDGHDNIDDDDIVMRVVGSKVDKTFTWQQLLPRSEVLRAQVLLGQQPEPQVGGRA